MLERNSEKASTNFYCDVQGEKQNKWGWCLVENKWRNTWVQKVVMYTF